MKHVSSHSSFSSTAKAGLLALAWVLVMANTPALRADQTEPGYSHESYALLPAPSWMKTLPDSLPLSTMSIPGTHDSGAQTGGDAVETQSMDVNTQLFAGVRVLDIRILFWFNEFDIAHGPIPMDTTFDQVLTTVTGFLQQNPGETVLMRIKLEDDWGANTDTFEQTFLKYQAKYAEYFWVNHAKETNPTLGELRGKIVVLQDFTANGSYGIPYSSFNIQDNYNYTNNWELYTKWTYVRNQLVNANVVAQICVPGVPCFQPPAGNQKVSYINYLSASGGMFPYFAASGKSSHGTGDPLLLTGLTTPGFASWYPDFPRVGCFLGMCSIAFEGTNNLTYDWLTAAPRSRVGIVMADFPGPGLIGAIIGLNRAAAEGFPPIKL